jgi:hypothetical protein
MESRQNVHCHRHHIGKSPKDSYNGHCIGTSPKDSCHRWCTGMSPSDSCNRHCTGTSPELAKMDAVLARLQSQLQRTLY